MNQPLIVFDLDGTLVDTADDLVSSVNFCLDHAGLEKIGRADLHHMVGQGGRVMLERAFRERGCDLDEQETDRHLLRFLDHYTHSMPGLSKPFNGALTAMDRLEDEGYGFAICTNKAEHLARRLIDSLGLTDRFSAICGGDSFDKRKPDPSHLKETIAKAGGQPDLAIMIGDSDADILTAKAAGIPVIAVDFGYAERPVATYGPDVVISSYSELTPQLVALLMETHAGESRRAGSA